MIEGTNFGEEEGAGGLADFPDVESFVAANNITDKYTCTVLKWDGDAGEWSHCDSFQDRTPSPAEAVRLYNVGRIKWKFVFLEKDPVTGRRPPAKEYSMSIHGVKWETMHEEYLAGVEETRIIKLRKRLEKQRVENQILGVNSSSPTEAPGKAEERMLNQMSTFASIMKPKGDDNGMMMMLFKIMGDNAALQQKSSDNMMQMMMQNSQNQMSLVMTLMQGQNKSPEILPLFNQIVGMVTTSMKLKDGMNPPQEQDRLTSILEFAKEVLPAAFKMLSPMPKAVRKMAVQGITKDSQEFQDLKSNPELLAGALKVWDKAYGREAVDELLEAASIPRPLSSKVPPPVVQDVIDDEDEDEDDYEGFQNTRVLNGHEREDIIVGETPPSGESEVPLS